MSLGKEPTPRRCRTPQRAIIAKLLRGEVGNETAEEVHGCSLTPEHGRRNPETDVTGDNAMTTGKIALAHLNEFPDYYTRLTLMEKEADESRP
jgi:hypothetical protein